MKPVLSGHRQFVWFEPRGRRPTQYEAYSIGQQSSPGEWLRVGWPIRFDDGRDPWVASSTALRCGRWADYRDPTQTWQRPYVAQHDAHQQTLAAWVPEMLGDGRIDRMAPAWRDVMLGTYYAAWPFAAYGQFLALSYSVREALSDTLTLAFAFEVADKLRQGQDIVHHLVALVDACPGFSDAGARAAWMRDPALVPVRELIERIHASDDWAEIAVALNLVLAPLPADLFESELLAAHGPANGDGVTPMILAGFRQDARRHVAQTRALVQLALADADHGADNARVVHGWLERWTPMALDAARALEPLFSISGVVATPFAPSFERVVARQRAIVEELGLDVGARR